MTRRCGWCARRGLGSAPTREALGRCLIGATRPSAAYRTKTGSIGCLARRAHRRGSGGGPRRVQPRDHLRSRCRSAHARPCDVGARRSDESGRPSHGWRRGSLVRRAKGLVLAVGMVHQGAARSAAPACSFNVLIIGRPQGLRTRNTKKSSSRIIVKRRNAEKLGLSATNKNGSW